MYKVLKFLRVYFVQFLFIDEGIDKFVFILMYTWMYVVSLKMRILINLLTHDERRGV